MLELEVYAAGVRDLNKILELDIELEAIPGLHYKVDRNHDIVYMELEAPTVTFREIRSIFRKLGLDPKFVGAIPADARAPTRVQRANTFRATREGAPRSSSVPARSHANAPGSSTATRGRAAWSVASIRPCSSGASLTTIASVTGSLIPRP